MSSNLKGKILRYTGSQIQLHTGTTWELYIILTPGPPTGPGLMEYLWAKMGHWGL